MDFTEELLHYVWKNRGLLPSNLQASNGKRLCVLRPGTPNAHSGPDFYDALICIDDIQLAGTVEMHLRSSDWYVHGHHHDLAYDNFILHVVYQHDQEVFRTDGTCILALELKSLIPQDLLHQYKNIIAAKTWIPCASSLASVKDIYKQSWLDRLLLERLESKSEEVFTLVREQKGSWDDAFYVSLAKNFGFKVNSPAFECLARSLPQTLLAKYKDQPLKIEALLYGQSGLLNNRLNDEYPRQLYIAYQFLKQKHRLQPLDSSIWKFMRLRPANFPTIRIAQFAALILRSSHLFSKILETDSPAAIHQLFVQLPINAYWERRYLFDKKSVDHGLQIGQGSIDNLLLNTVAVFLFAYGWHHDFEYLRSRAIYLLETLSPEQIQVIRKYADLGMKVQTAAGSQALLQLKKYYCENKKCLSCGIGTKILNPD